ncbi:MAG: phenylacetate--CoA ligase family protein [Deltaproteobacteria bacterium]|nr:phenylacetate--CoA ligase family protein [Deltaproteobacteria bacterium]
MSLVPFVASAAAALWRERFWSPVQFSVYQRRRLSRLVRHAAEHVPLYRSLYAGIDPDRFELTDLPPIDRDLMRRNFASTVADERIALDDVLTHLAQVGITGGQLRGRYLVASTSGTTGEVGYLLCQQRDWARQLGVLFARLLRGRLHPTNVLRFGPWRRYRMAYVVATGGPFITFLISRFDAPFAAIAADMRAFSIGANIDDNVRELNAFRPHHLHGYPTALELLAREQLAGRLRIEPEVVSLGSEPVTALARSVLTRAFRGADLRITYGTTECLPLANQCRAGRLHINEDACIVEPIDRNGVAVAPGTTSDHVLITNLLNTGQPLVRYRLDDQIVVDKDRCPCGSALHSLQVIGRTDDVIYLRRGDGSFVALPPIPFELVFLNVHGLKQYQLVHRQQNELHIRFVTEPEADAGAIDRDLVRAFSEFLRERGLGHEVLIHCEQVDRIARDPTTQKIRQIQSLVAVPEIVAAAGGGVG